MNITPARARWLGRIGKLFMSTVGATWRIRTAGTPLPQDNAIILAFLHGDMLLPTRIYRRRPVAVLTSEHGDGEVIAQVIARVGYVPVRGSSSRGGARAFLELLREHEHRMIAITPDGPRGPRGSVQEGIIQLAARSQRPIYATSYAVAKGKRLSSWDSFVIPAPFTRVVEKVSPPLAVPEKITPEQRVALAKELEARFVTAHEEAQNALAAW